MKFILLIFVNIILITSTQVFGLPQNSGQDRQPEQIFNPKEVDEKFVIKERPRAQYTDKARNNCTNGTVRLTAVLRSNGKIGEVTIIKGLPDGLSSAAIDAARKIKFKPAKKNGQKVSVLVHIEYNFDLACRN